MRLRMIQNRRGSSDGLRVRQYKAGEVYDIETSLAREFLQKGYAEVEGWEIPKDKPKRKGSWGTIQEFLDKEYGNAR